MALSAFRDPRRAVMQRAAAAQTATDQARAGGKQLAATAGKAAAVDGSAALQVIPKRKPLGVPAAALPGTVNNVVPVDKPDVARPQVDPRTQLAQVADQMKTQRESGDLGSLLKTTNEQYLPQVQKLQTTMGTFDTGQVARLLGENAKIPQALPEQQRMLTELATKLQQARESGDMGTANSLGQQYASLVKAMHGQVTGQPVMPMVADPAVKAQFDALLAQRKLAQSSGSDLPPDRLKLLQDMQAQLQTGQPASAEKPVAAVNLNAPATPMNLPAGTKPYQVINAGSRSEGYYDETGKFIYGQPPADKVAAAQIDAQKAMQQAATAAGSPISSGDQPSRSGSGGGTPGSQVPTGETDASVQNPPAPTGQPAPYDAAQSWSTRMANPGLKIKQGGRMYDDPAGAQKIQSLVDYDSQFIAGFPPEGQAWVSTQMALEQKNFDQAIAQYPDQWDKIFRDHQTRVKDIQAKWESSGQFEARLNKIFDEAPPEAKVKIDSLPEVQKNEFYRQAIEDMKNGIDPLTKVDGYLAKFGETGDFQLKDPGFQVTDYKLDEFKPLDDPTVAAADAVDLTTDKSRIDQALSASGMTQEGQAALKLQMETIQKRLANGGGGFSEEELTKMAAPMFDQIDRDLAAQLTASQHDMAAGGYDTAAINAKSTEIRQAAAAQKKQAAIELVRENMGYKQSGTSEAIAALGGISESERQGALAEKKLGLEGATTQTTLSSEEKQAQAQANFQQKALFQEGNLTVWGKKTQRDLDLYGMQLDKYQTDKGLDVERLKIDLQERIADQGGSIEQARIQADKVAKSIEAAGREAELYDRRAAGIAELEQRAASGDQDAAYKVQALKVQQELSVLGLKSEQTKMVANILYGMRAQGLQLTQEMKMFIEQMLATEEAQQSGGFMEAFGSIVGGVAGSFLGPVAGAVGAKVGKDLVG